MADDNSNASTMMVALIAILVIVAVGFIVLRVMPGADNDGGVQLDTGGGDGGGVTGGSIEVGE